MSRLDKLVRGTRLLANLPRQWRTRPFYGFIQGHSYLTKQELIGIHDCIGAYESHTVKSFEDGFTAVVGQGSAVSFASGRMGFYALMKILEIGPGEEVILLGSTCSVMVNAVLRTGATPIFADIDSDTFGSSAEHIQKRITLRTRMIVAQHSFGIPCDINPIVDLAHARGIFLLEDCAISLGSTIDGITLGNFGDAALFSSDHSKPINTLIGGLIYTRDSVLRDKLRKIQESAAELSLEKQQALWRRLLIESHYCQQTNYGRLLVIDILMMIKNRVFKQQSPFLDEDFRAAPSKSYPYPAKLPSLLAMVGVYELRRWPQVAKERKELLAKLLDIAKNSAVAQYLPKAYFNPRLDIVPLRFVWTQPTGAAMRMRFSGFVPVTWTWFMQPIIATTEPLERFGYFTGDCSVAERIGAGMVNLPCNVSHDDSGTLVWLFYKALEKNAT